MQIVQHAKIAIRHGINSVDEIWAGNVQPFLPYFGILEAEQIFGLRS
jgi:hypothetical protein